MVCGKPFYRRPYELVKVRHVACMEHRALAQTLMGVTEAQKRGLSLGREKGTNHRAGYTHREESKIKTSMSNLVYWNEHSEQAKARGRRGEQHYRWKGGSSRLNTSIRQMTENRVWMDAIKKRDGCCQRCGSIEKLEAHHLKELAHLIAELGIKSREDARQFADALWDLANGETLCEVCHYREHGRKKPLISRRKRRAAKLQILRT